MRDFFFQSIQVKITQHQFVESFSSAEGSSENTEGCFWESESLISNFNKASLISSSDAGLTLKLCWANKQQCIIIPPEVSMPSYTHRFMFAFQFDRLYILSNWLEEGKEGKKSTVCKTRTGNQSVTSRSRDFPVSRLLPIFSSLGFGIGKFGLGKKVSVSVSTNLVSEKEYWYRS